MKVSINFNGVLDHLDVLDEEASKANVLMDHIQNICQNVPEENYELLMHMKNISNSIESLQRNIRGRKELLQNIVYELKNVKQSTHDSILEIEYMVNSLNDGE